MLERDCKTPIVPETIEAERSTYLLRKVIPHRVSILLVSKMLGEGLTDEGRRKFKDIIGRMLQGQHVSVSQELARVYEDADFVFTKEGEENIPESGATLFLGNHTRGGPLAGMGQYFEAARSVYNMRTGVESENLREPVAIAQRGLTKVIKLPGGRKIVWNIPLTGQFYDLAAQSIGWVTVIPPKFDSNGQIFNKQRLPKRVSSDLVSGGALLWFPQGKHRDVDYLTMPEKSTGLLTKLKDEDVNLVAVRFIPGNNSLGIFFSRAVHIQDISYVAGTVDVAAFVRNYMRPLGE